MFQLGIILGGVEYVFGDLGSDTMFGALQRFVVVLYTSWCQCASCGPLSWHLFFFVSLH